MVRGCPEPRGQAAPGPGVRPGRLRGVEPGPALATGLDYPQRPLCPGGPFLVKKRGKTAEAGTHRSRLPLLENGEREKKKKSSLDELILVHLPREVNGPPPQFTESSQLIQNPFKFPPSRWIPMIRRQTNRTKITGPQSRLQGKTFELWYLQQLFWGK